MESLPRLQVVLPTAAAGMTTITIGVLLLLLARYEFELHSGIRPDAISIGFYATFIARNQSNGIKVTRTRLREKMATVVTTHWILRRATGS